MFSVSSKLKWAATLTTLLAALWFLFPTDAVRSTIAIVGLFLGVPLFLMGAIDLVRHLNSADTEMEPHSVFARAMTFPVRILVGLLGVCSVLFGAAIMLWILYNLFVERHEQFRGGVGVIGGFGIAPTMMLVGAHFLRLASGREDSLTQRVGPVDAGEPGDEEWDAELDPDEVAVAASPHPSLGQ